MVDSFSGYLYFVDTLNSTADTTYYKPWLAFPDDVQPYVGVDADDYMQGNRYSKQDFQRGPYIKVSGLNKYDAGRAEMPAFIAKNPEREVAVRTYGELNTKLHELDIGEVVIFMDGEKPTHLEMSEYHYMRASIVDHDWRTVLSIMQSHENNLLIQLFGFHSLAKSHVPIDGSGSIDYVSSSMSHSLHVF